MSKYTTELRFICEHSAGLVESVGYDSIDEVLDKSRDKIFDFDFPIFDESYRNVLENKILKHYYTREICCETVGRWKLFLNTKMNEIMPYYNQLYRSALIEFNPMYDVDLVTDHQRVDNGNNERTTETTDTDVFSETNSRTDEGETHRDDNNWQYFSDTPEGDIDGVASRDYLTTATNNTVDSDILNSLTSEGNRQTNDNRNRNETSEQTIKNVEDYLQHVKGKRGGITYSKMLEEYRRTFLNIDMQIINELKDLFMNIW